MKPYTLKKLIALAAIALSAACIEKASAIVPTNNWVNVGPSAGGGFVINGNGPSDAGPLSLTTSPTSLSSNGFNIVTLNAGVSASSSSLLSQTIKFQNSHNTFNNYGTVSKTLIGDGIDVVGQYNTINNYGTGTITGEYFGIYVNTPANDPNNNVLINNWGTVNAYDSSGAGVQLESYGTLNNYNTRL
jgi:hypothetical protein